MRLLQSWPDESEEAKTAAQPAPFCLNKNTDPHGTDSFSLRLHITSYFRIHTLLTAGEHPNQHTSAPGPRTWRLQLPSTPLPERSLQGSVKPSPGAETTGHESCPCFGTLSFRVGIVHNQPYALKLQVAPCSMHSIAGRRARARARIPSQALEDL